jgi:hypothetical protein
MKLILICLLMLVGCERAERNQQKAIQESANNIQYIKDQRTGLCFVQSYVSEYPIGTATIYTNVPCSPEVELLIKQDKK